MKIFKYEFPIRDKLTIKLPRDANILDIQYQGNQLVLWAIVNPENQLIDFNFKIFGTGHDIDTEIGLLYITTVQDTQYGLVWHIFYETPCEHKSDGMIYTSNPPQNKCKKCGEFYR